LEYSRIDPSRRAWSRAWSLKIDLADDKQSGPERTFR
jgi:hypothetical protein